MFDSRPAALIRELVNIGALPIGDVEHVGRVRRGLGAVLDAVELLRRMDGPPSVVLSPLAFRREARSGLWFDAYDDWSLAPEMGRGVKLLSRIGYSSLRSVADDALVTVNSEFMADKLASVAPILVPNGVDPALADWRLPSHDVTRRVLLLGHFFRGRTDWTLFENILSSRVAEEVIVVGTGAAVRERVARASTSGATVKLLPPTPLSGLSQWLGRCTVLAIPHCVSDYTMSQDLMKAYQAVALGIPFVVPNALWPASIPRELGLVFEIGTSVDDVLASAFTWERLDLRGRRAFCQDNSWRRRAELVAEQLP